MHLRKRPFLAALLLLVCSPVQAVPFDLEYGKIGSTSLKLDLHLPPKPKAPLVVYIHGGAWRSGSKANPPILDLLKQGFAIASIDYRLSTEAVFPAQIHDIKAAIRFLRAKADRYGYDAERIGIIGSSAGGHLAALTGVTNGETAFDGTIADHLDQSSNVQCIISLYGASNLQSILSQSSEQAIKMREPALKLLLGGHPDQNPEAAKLASPVAHLDKADPPLLLIHGDADPQMPLQQSQEFAKAYEALGLSVQFITLPGAKHGGDEFYDKERMEIMAKFLQTHLQKP